MKKIILIISIFLLTGCYDYKEINDLALVSSIFLDYDNEYKLSFEILNNIDNSYIINESGQTIEEAFDNINNKISNNAYYNHLKVFIISKNIAEKHLEDIIDYITRNPNIRNEFYIVVTNNLNEIININDENKTISEKISKLLEANNKKNYIQNEKVFEDFLQEIINPYTYGIINEIEVNNNDIEIKGLSFFKNYYYQDTLNKENSKLVNLINEKKDNIIIDYNNITMKIDYFDTIYTINKNNIQINIKAYAQIISNNNDIDIKKNNYLNRLSNKYSNVLNNKLNNLLDYMLTNNYDILNLNNIYYKKYKTTKDNIKDYNITFNTNVIINKKGLTFNE